MAPSKLGSKDFQRTTLRPHHRLVVRAIAEALFSPDGEVNPERLDAFVDDVDRYFSPASKTLRFGLLLMLTAIRWSPLVSFSLQRLDEMPLSARVRHLERVERSRFTLLVVAYRTVLTFLFYEDPAELSRIGYPGAERHRWKRGLPLAEPR